MTEKRYKKVLGLIEKNNGDLLDLTEIENELNQLVYENEQLKSILFDVVEQLKVKINPNENTLWAVTLVVDGKMYSRIKEIIK